MNGALRASPDPVEDLDLCGSDGLPSEKAMVEAVIDWGEKHPEHWSDQMIIGAALALHDTWPCPQRF
jgi:hypothetical protein